MRWLQKRKISHWVFDIGNYLFFLVLTVVFLLPFTHIVMYSLSDISHYSTAGIFLYPRGFDVEIYDALLFKGIRIPSALATSLFVTIIGTFLSVLISAMMAYAITKPFKGRGVVVGLIFFSMIFYGGMVPTWLVVRSLGLLDTPWALIQAWLLSGFNVFILRNFILLLPGSLEESVLMDGGTHLIVFFRIILPLSKPALVTVALIIAINYWNDYFSSILYIFDASKWPLAALIRDLISRSNLTMTAGGVVAGLNPARLDNVKVRSATMVISMLPVLAAYPFAQKYFERGMILGSVKG